MPSRLDFAISAARQVYQESVERRREEQELREFMKEHEPREILNLVKWLEFYRPAHMKGPEWSLRGIAEGIAYQIAARERNECAAALCRHCREGLRGQYTTRGYYHVRKGGKLVRCRAAVIKNRNISAEEAWREAIRKP